MSQVTSPREHQYTFLILCLCYATIQVAIMIHSVPDLALYRELFCTELFPDNHTKFNHGQSQDPRCAADSISERVAILTGTLGLFENIPGMLLVLFYGWVSDTYGRRVVFFSLLIGGIVQPLIMLYTAMHFTTLGVKYFYLASLLAGMAGTNPALRTATWSIIVDCMPDERRIRAFSVITAINYIGMVVGPASGSLLLNVHLLLPLWTCTVLLVLALCLIWYMPETLVRQESTVHPYHQGTWAVSFRREFLSMTKSSLQSLRLLISSRNACILGIIAFIWDFSGGVMLVVVQYLNQAFEWSITNGGYFYSVFASLKVFVLLVLLPAFCALAFRQSWRHIDSRLLTCGLLGDGIAYASYSFMTSTTALPFILVLQAVCAPLSVSLRVLIARLAESKQIGESSGIGSGQIFAAISVLEGLGDLAGPAVWNGIYAAMLGTSGSGRFVFLIVAVAYLFGAVLSFFYQNNELEHLLHDSFREGLLAHDLSQSI